jgi:DNA-binding NtrC family response regulator
MIYRDKKKILIGAAMKEPVVIELCECLEKDGYIVEMVSECSEIIRKIKNKDCDVLVVDLDINSKNTIDIIPQIRKSNPRLPVIVISGDSSIELARKIRMEGIYFYSIKPLDVPEMRLAVRDAVRSIETKSKEVPLKISCLS